ncbi:MAG TPA: type VI secretion system tube protein TssD [Gaiellaceae bacterium]|nr:type VI secretion system tube protein TssD [Gaiellaceae bacterium]
MRRRFAIGAALVAVLAAAGTTYALAASGASTTQTINACVKANGDIRLVSAAANCRRDETAISWNTVGPAGPQGPQGIAGRDGQTGPQGPAGVSGTNPPDPDDVAATVTVTGQKQGPFSNDPIPVTAVSHEIVSPRDPASGLPTGKRQHKPITITKEVDASSPLFLNALVTNENLKTVVITLTTADKTVETITLTNASVAQYDQHGGNETIQFTYQKIEWQVGNALAEDDWEAQVS